MELTLYSRRRLKAVPGFCGQARHRYVVEDYRVLDETSGPDAEAVLLLRSARGTCLCPMLDMQTAGAPTLAESGQQNVLLKRLH
jgi:hypothetical protein